jgi:hypothetical protein
MTGHDVGCLIEGPVISTCTAKRAEQDAARGRNKETVPWYEDDTRRVADGYHAHTVRYCTVRYNVLAVGAIVFAGPEPVFTVFPMPRLLNPCQRIDMGESCGVDRVFIDARNRAKMKLILLLPCASPA